MLLFSSIFLSEIPIGYCLCVNIIIIVLPLFINPRNQWITFEKFTACNVWLMSIVRLLSCLIVPLSSTRYRPLSVANPSRRLRQIAGIADASQHANRCFTGMHAARMAENDRARRAASPSRRSEKSRSNRCESWRRRHVENEMPWKVHGVNILWPVRDIMCAYVYYIYIYMQTRVHLQRRIADLQRGKCIASLAHLRPLAGVSVLTLGIYYSIIATCGAMSFWYSHMLPTLPQRDIQRHQRAKIFGERFWFALYAVKFKMIHDSAS